jgi:hypothetical protein
VVDIGEPSRIANEYLDVNFQQEKPASAVADKEPDRFGDQRAEIAEAWFEDEHGMRTSQLHTGKRCAFAARVRFNEAIDDPLFGFVLQNSQKTTVLQASTLEQGRSTGRFAAGDEIEFRISFDNVFAPDRYFATPAIARGGGMIAWIDRREQFASVVVTGTRDTDAVVDIPFQIEIERDASAASTQPGAPA